MRSTRASGATSGTGVAAFSASISRRDSRPVVPKRNRWMGATFNVGHPLGKALMLVVLGVVVTALLLGF